MNSKCPNGHPLSWKCFKNIPVTCVKCEREAKLAEERQQEAFRRQQKQQEEQLAHNQRLAELERKIALQRQTVRDAQIDQDRQIAIQQKEKDLEEATSQAARSSLISGANGPQDAKRTLKQKPADSEPPRIRKENQTPLHEIGDPNLMQSKETTAKVVQPLPKSPSEDEWRRLKDDEGESNDAIDGIMDLIGLEDVKKQVLRIKAKVDTAKRQCVSLKDERFNVVLLGNPGTGIFLILTKEPA
jgi:hypothetical protein